MIQHIISVYKFINESRYYSYVDVIDLAKRVFTDFTFEEPIPALVSDLDTYYYGLKEKYIWNRELKEFRKEHFALNVKIYVWPDVDRVREILDDPEVSDERINSIWWHWLNDQRDVLLEGLDYAWLMDKGFGGKSGGWLLLAPNSTPDHIFENLEEAIYSYVGQKSVILREIDVDHLKKYDANPEYAKLAEVGLVHDLAPLSEVKEACDEVKTIVFDSKTEAEQINTDIEAILAQVDRFRKEGITWFYEYLEQEYMPDFVEDDEDYN
jgi:hypothetical protein